MLKNFFHEEKKKNCPDNLNIYTAGDIYFFGKSVDRSLLLQIIPFSNMNGFTGRASYFQFKV